MSSTTTSESNAKPTYIYKLVPFSSPVPDLADLPERLPVSDLDKASGFVHLSTALQVPNTLKWFFKDDPRVYVLQLNYDELEKDIKWEDPKAEVCGPRGGEGMFPVSTYSSRKCIFIHYSIHNLAPL